MGFSDLPATPEQIASFRASLNEYQNSVKDAKLAEASRIGVEKEFEDQAGVIWRYGLIDDRFVRVTGCDASANSGIARIPDKIEELPVMEIWTRAFDGNKTLVELTCSDQIASIGNYAFRRCSNLSKIKFPHLMETFENDWLRDCENLEVLVLPGMLEKIGNYLFDVCIPKTLVIGPGTREISIGVFSKSTLESVSISQENPYLATDGNAIFTKDGTKLIAMAVHTDEYEIPKGCLEVCEKAFVNNSKLDSIGMPDSIEKIDDYAFMQSGLRSFVAKPSLKEIGNRAFFRCSNLQYVTLTEGLESIGESAFAGTGLTALHIPATVKHLGHDFASNTAVSFSGDAATFGIEPESRLHVDIAGGLYDKQEDGIHLLRFMGQGAEYYEVLPGTRFIGDRAFIRNPTLKKVRLPEGLEEIGRSAFSGCHNLACVNIPSTVKIMAPEAFYDTSIESLEIPECLESIGEFALTTHGALNDSIPPSLNSISVDPNNRRYFVDDGLLCEHLEDGSTKILLYLDVKESVNIKPEVSRIADLAFGGARNLKELILTNRIKKIGRGAFDIDCVIEHIHIYLKEPIDGRTEFDLHFPPTTRSRREITLALGQSERVDVVMLLRHYDDAIINMSDYGGMTAGGFGRYRQAKSILERIKDPVMMTSVKRGLFDRVMKNNIVDICEAIARHDDRDAIRDLIELGYLDEKNLLEVIERVGKLQDAAMTGYLLEAKRRYFKHDLVDFDL